MNLTFAQAARGVNKDIIVNVVDTCIKCHGSRCELGTKPSKCQYCNGSGMETVSTGPFIMRSTCRYCAGTGQYNKYPCTECEGKGQSVSTYNSTINSLILTWYSCTLGKCRFNAKKSPYPYLPVLKMDKLFEWQSDVGKFSSHSSKHAFDG